MALAPGSRIGPYEIVALLGVGGMGEVYRARDERLRRDVALKVLPEGYVADPDRRARFEREARLLGALNHPNIAAIHGFEEAPAGAGPTVGALIMELVEGHTLSDRIAAGPLPVDETISIALQLVEALDAAHEKNIVHRDLKPLNIKVTPEGVVKVLDFGLARVTAESSSDALRTTAALPIGGTQEGVILGTASYMSPEQARGRPVDKRTDIWAFGCILYEMLTGRLVFPGGTLSDVVAGVLGREPDWTTLPDATPTALRRLLRRCLDKDPRRRLRDIGDARVSLEELDDAAATPSGSAWTRTRFLAAAAVASAVILGAVATGAWLGGGGTARPALGTIRLQVAPPPGGAFAEGVETVSMAFSPDGSRLAYAAIDATGKRQIWLRALDAVDSVPVPGTENALSLFWSPDSESIGFFADGVLKRLKLGSGTPITVCDTPRSVGLTGTWAENGDALFASVQGDGIFRVSMNGGTPVAVVRPDASRMESRTAWPSFLPGGDRFVYLLMNHNGDGQLMLAEDGSPPRPIQAGQSNGQYVEPGYLVFASEGVLLGQRFDPASGRLTGEPTAIAEAVNYFMGTGRAIFTASRTGSVAFQPAVDEYRLAWIDLAGRETGTVSAPGFYIRLRISPDGRSVLFDRAQQGLGTQDLWMLNLDRDVETRLTSDRMQEGAPVWLPDGVGYFYNIARGSAPNIHRGSLATGKIEQALPKGGLQEPGDVSPDGRHLVFSERLGDGQFDLWSLALADNRQSPLVQSARFDEEEGRFSRDSRFVAFTSNESGRPDVYLTPFPSGGVSTRISPRGGSMPRWAPNGRDLLYMSADNRLMSVRVQTTPSLKVGVPVPLFALPAGVFWRSFEISADGTRFMAIIPNALSSTRPVTVIANWLAEVGAR